MLTFPGIIFSVFLNRGFILFKILSLDLCCFKQYLPGLRPTLSSDKLQLFSLKKKIGQRLWGFLLITRDNIFFVNKPTFLSVSDFATLLLINQCFDLAECGWNQYSNV